MLILLENMNKKLDYQDIDISAIYKQNLQRQHSADGTDCLKFLSLALTTIEII